MNWPYLGFYFTYKLHTWYQGTTIQWPKCRWAWSKVKVKGQGQIFPKMCKKTKQLAISRMLFHPPTTLFLLLQLFVTHLGAAVLFMFWIVCFPRVLQIANKILTLQLTPSQQEKLELHLSRMSFEQQQSFLVAQQPVLAKLQLRAESSVSFFLLRFFTFIYVFRILVNMITRGSR